MRITNIHSVRGLVVSASLLIAGPVFGQVGLFAVEEAKLTASDAFPGQGFGTAVSVAGNTAVIGAPTLWGNGGPDSGSAFIFTWDGTSWTQQTKLVAADGAAGDSFGSFVAVSGDTAVVGAFADDHAGGVNAGSAYVFVRHGATWSQQAKLVASDASAADYFGWSVALSGDTALIGASGDDYAGDFSGSAYVFVRSGTTWTQQAKLVAPNGAALDNFGYSVAVSGDTAVVGRYDLSAYVFVRSGSAWTTQAELVPLDGTLGDTFGYSVAISGDTAVVGAVLDDLPGGTNAGSAYVFTRSGPTWIQAAKLTATDAAASELFGASVSVSDDVVVVGAQDGDVAGATDAGSAYVFLQSGATWTQRAKLTASDAGSNNYFGTSVAVSGNRVLAGARSNPASAGAAYVFGLVATGSWASLGIGLAGTAGVPVLTGTGNLVAGAPVLLSLTQAKPFSLVPLVIGVGALNAPFKGGVLVPYPNYIFPLFTDFFGKSTFGGLWPPGVPSGFTTYFQWWIQDPAGPQGYAASNAVAGTAP